MPPEISHSGFGPLAAPRLQRFAASLLAEAGALVEPIAPATLEVLSPPAVQEKLGLAELTRLSFAPTPQPGAIAVGLEADWLDRFGRLLGPRGRTARFVLSPCFRPPADAEGLLAALLVLDNATFRLLDAAPAWTRLLLFEFRFTAIADEKCQGLLRLALNLGTGALIDDPPVPETTSFDPSPDLPPDLPPAPDHPRLLALLALVLSRRLDAALAPFVESLLRRLARDQDRLHSFHNDLHHETERRLAGLAVADPARRREESRIGAIGREYSARIEDLSRQYALSVAVAWTQTQELVLPVHRLTVQLRRRKADRTLFIDWNPLTRRLDPLTCDWSPGAGPPRLVCDQALHLLSPDGLAPCAACARPFCRACHAACCPKCGQPLPALSALPLTPTSALH